MFFKTYLWVKTHRLEADKDGLQALGGHHDESSPRCKKVTDACIGVTPVEVGGSPSLGSHRWLITAGGISLCGGRSPGSSLLSLCRGLQKPAPLSGGGPATELPTLWPPTPTAALGPVRDDPTGFWGRISKSSILKMA